MQTVCFKKYISIKRYMWIQKKYIRAQKNTSEDKKNTSAKKYIY